MRNAVQTQGVLVTGGLAKYGVGARQGTLEERRPQGGEVAGTVVVDENKESLWTGPDILTEIERDEEQDCERSKDARWKPDKCPK